MEVAPQEASVPAATNAPPVCRNRRREYWDRWFEIMLAPSLRVRTVREVLRPTIESDTSLRSMSEHARHDPVSVPHKLKGKDREYKRLFHRRREPEMFARYATSPFVKDPVKP